MKTWFKFYGVEYLADPKMDLLNAVEKALWTTILCYASISDEEGVIRNIDEDQIMRKTNLNDNEKLSNRNFLNKFATKKYNMISIDNEDDQIVIKLLNYEKRQKALSPYERVKSYREREKLDKQPQLITKSYQNDNNIDKRREDKNRIKTTIPPSSGSKPKGIELLKAKIQDLKLDKSDPFDNPTDKALVEKANLMEKAGIGMVLGLLFLISATFTSLQAKTIKLTYKLNLSRPSCKLVKAPVPLPKTTKPELIKPTGADIESKILRAFGKDGQIMLAIAHCESGLRPNAVGDGHLTFIRDGVEYGKSYGVFQIRHLQGRPDPDKLLDPDFNIEYAKGVLERQGFNAWSVYSSGCYKAFL